MGYTLFLLCFILNGCWHSNGCFYTPQMVNCVDKGKEYPLIAGYQKKELLGHTNSKQRWKDLVSCGGKYGDINLHYYPQNYQINDKRYKNLDECMNTKGYIYLSPVEWNVAIKILSGIRENVTYKALNLLFKQSAVKNLGVFKF